MSKIKKSLKEMVKSKLSKIFDIKDSNKKLEISLYFCNPKKHKFILSTIKYCKIESNNIVTAAKEIEPENMDAPMQNSYWKDLYTSPLLVSFELIEELYRTLEYIANKNLTDKEKKDIFKEIKYKIFKAQKMDYHIGCFSYPNCDIDPNGCRYQRQNPEPYGHR